MIGNQSVLQYCSGDITEIENFKEALHDRKCTWECHHRRENNPDGSPAYSSSELKEQGMYYNRPPSEFIFLKPDQHRKLKQKRKKPIAHTRHEEDCVYVDELWMISEIEIDKAVREYEEDMAEHPKDYRQVYKCIYCIRNQEDRIRYMKEKAKYDADPETYKADWDKQFGGEYDELPG